MNLEEMQLTYENPNNLGSLYSDYLNIKADIIEMSNKLNIIITSIKNHEDYNRIADTTEIVDIERIEGILLTLLE